MIPNTTNSASVTETENPATPSEKKSVVKGLPSQPRARSGFPGASGHSDYKAKSSKATGAKKRVRQ